MALDTEHISSSGTFSGISTKAGGLLTVKMKPKPGTIGNHETQTHEMLYLLCRDP